MYDADLTESYLASIITPWSDVSDYIHLVTFVIILTASTYLHSDYIMLFLHKLNPTFWVINWSFNICKQNIYGLYCTIFSKYFSEL